MSERTDRWVLVRTIPLPLAVDGDWAVEQTDPDTIAVERFSRGNTLDLLGDDPGTVRFYFVCADGAGEVVRGANDLELDLGLVLFNDKGHVTAFAEISQTPGVDGLRLGYVSREPNQGWGFQDAAVRVNGFTGAPPAGSDQIHVYASRVTAKGLA